MPFHFCIDEFMALMAGLPVLGYAFRWLRIKFWNKKPPAIECCEHPHTHELPEAVHVED